MIDNSSKPGDIKKFQISPNSGGQYVEASSIVSEFRYYESVLSNTVTATAVIVETGLETSQALGGSKSLLDGLPIRGGERTDIEISDANDVKLNFKNGLYINRVRNGSPGTQKDLYFLDFASKEYFANEQTRVVKRYKDAPISTHVKSIVGLLGPSMNVDVDDTARNYNFYGNDRKPFYILTWLASKSIPSSAGTRPGMRGTAGYLFYQTIDGLFFKSIDGLLKQESKKRYIYTNTPDLPENYDGKIVSYSIDADIDLQQNMALGVYNNRTLAFNPANFNYIDQRFDISEQSSRIDTAGKRNLETGNLVDRDFTKSPTRLMTAVIDVGFNQPGTGDDMIKNYKQNKNITPNDEVRDNLVQHVMRYNQLFTIQTKITIPGDFTIRAGDMIDVTYDQLRAQDGKAAINTKTSGKYLVAHVCHSLSRSETFTSLTLVRDSYGVQS